MWKALVLFCSLIPMCQSIINMPTYLDVLRFAGCTMMSLTGSPLCTRARSPYLCIYIYTHLKKIHIYIYIYIYTYIYIYIYMWRVSLQSGKAFSRLRHQAKLMDDPKAQPFYSCIHNIKVIQPVAIWLAWGCSRQAMRCFLGNCPLVERWKRHGLSFETKGSLQVSVTLDISFVHHLHAVWLSSGSS